jgi:hypothetical protein
MTALTIVRIRGFEVEGRAAVPTISCESRSNPPGHQHEGQVNPDCLIQLECDDCIVPE